MEGDLSAILSHVARSTDRRVFARMMHLWLGLLLVMVSVASLAIGASDTSLWGSVAKLARGIPLTQIEAVVLWDIRAPRLIMGIRVGAALAVCGAVMQGLFRNPLADPGLIGVSAGAGLGAICAIVLGGFLPVAAAGVVGTYLVPVAAFFGGWVSTLVL